MRYATTPGWVILFVPQPTGTMVGAIWLVMGAALVFFSARALRGRREDDRIRREGTPATATLLSAQTTGLLVNNVPQWRFRLRIDDAGAPYEATMQLCTYSPPAPPVNAAGSIAGALQQAGQNGTASSAAVTVRLLGDLDRMHASGARAPDEFESLKRKLLGEA